MKIWVGPDACGVIPSLVSGIALEDVTFLDAEGLNSCRENKRPKSYLYRVVNFSVWDFIEPKNYIFLELHIEISLVNNTLDKFYDWVEGHVEVASTEEKICWNRMIIFDTELLKAIVKL